MNEFDSTNADSMNALRPREMLDQIGNESSSRKMRLFAIACCRTVIHHFHDSAALQILDLAEESVDEIHNDGKLLQVIDAYNSPEEAIEDNAALSLVIYDASQAIDSVIRITDAYTAAHSTSDWVSRTVRDFDSEKICADLFAQTGLIRDIFGMPFFCKTIDPRCLSEAVMGIAKSIYCDKAYSAMPILADALEDAGCNDAEILSHCRDSTPHVRGCWVVDLILGKK